MDNGEVITVFPHSHYLHHGVELDDGAIRPCWEEPRRADMVRERIDAVGLGHVITPDAHGVGAYLRVHDAAYIRHLETAWDSWSAQGFEHQALPLVWPVPGLRGDREPCNIEGRLGFFSMDASCSIGADTWGVVRASADAALTAASLIIDGAESAFALCRPPGHHAGAGFMGGYCYLNNAAIAAQAMLDSGLSQVAILDVDFHHGNGTQEIFYSRSDAYFASIHADPSVSYPYFLGFADERGSGAGEGSTANYPLPPGTQWPTYAGALESALAGIRAAGPEALVISLGVDTFEGDPISSFRLASPDYLSMGAAIAQAGVPTLFVFEGGYAVESIAVNAVNVLQGFEGA